MNRQTRIFLIICISAFSAAFIVQTIFQSLGAARSQWGGNPGWQREIAFWSVGAATIAYRTLKLDQSSMANAVSLGFTVLFFLLGTNHLIAFVNAPYAQFHWPPLLLNYVGFLFGARVLIKAGTKSGVKERGDSQPYSQAECQRQATRPGLAVHGTLSPARARRPAVVARLARTLRL